MFITLNNAQDGISFKHPLQPLARKRTNRYNKSTTKGFSIRSCNFLQMAFSAFLSENAQFTPEFISLYICCRLLVYGLMTCNFVCCSGEANQEFGIALSTLQRGFDPPFAAEPMIFNTIDDLLTNL